MQHKYTVIAVVEATGEILAKHVVARTAIAAFVVAATHEQRIVNYVAALPGHLIEEQDIEYPGTAVVDNETIMEQPDVFPVEEEVAKLPMSNEYYVASEGAKCPLCESADTSGGGVDIQGGTALQTMGCDSCEQEWEDVYRLVGYRRIK
jgi:hypothetical protein